MPPLAVKMTSFYSGRGEIERHHKGLDIHRDRDSNSKQLRHTGEAAVYVIKASQIFKRNKESDSLSRQKNIQTIKDVYDVMAAERMEACA